MHIAFHGLPGADGESAAQEFAPDAERVGCPHAEDVCHLVAAGGADAGVLAIENSTGGTIHRHFDLIVKDGLRVVGEVELRIVRCLYGLEGAAPDALTRLYAHPQSIAECGHFLTRRRACEIVVSFDVAEQARRIGSERLVSEGVIASARLGPSLGLARLADGVQDHADNVTRYAVVGRPGGWRPTDRVPTKSTILFTVPDKSGALHRALSAFALRDVDLTKLESRPIPGRPWEYVFYADLASSADDIRCQRAIANLREFAPMVRVLGSYAAYRAPVAAAGARSAQAVAPGFEWALPDARES